MSSSRRKKLDGYRALLARRTKPSWYCQSFPVPRGAKDFFQRPFGFFSTWSARRARSATVASLQRACVVNTVKLNVLQRLGALRCQMKCSAP